MRRILLAGAVVAAAVFVTPLDAATSYIFDNLGRLWVVTYDNGYQITYSYDSAGNRTSVVTQTGTTRPPQANNDYITVLENGSDTYDPRVNDANPDGGTLTITAVSAAAHGTAAINSGTPPPNVTYTPNSGYLGNDSFTYTIADTSGHTSSATEYVTVTNVGPVANGDNVTTPISTAVTYDPRTTDVEPAPPGYPLTIVSTTLPGHGSVAIDSGTSLTYTPVGGYTGNDTFTYTISDGHGLTSTATETMTVGNPPVAVDDYILTAAGTPITYDPLSNDSDPNGYSLSIASTGTSANSTSAIVGGSAITYTPNAGFTGLDTFTYTITDARLTATATEHVCVGSPLTATDYTGYIIELDYSDPFIPSKDFAPNPLPNVTDACGATFTVTSVGTPAQGSAIVDPGGTGVSYSYGILVTQENSPVNATETFTYTVSDSYGATATANMTVHVAASVTPD